MNDTSKGGHHPRRHRQGQDISSFLEAPENEDTLKNIRKMYRDRLREVEALSSKYFSPIVSTLDKDKDKDRGKDPFENGIRIASDPLKLQQNSRESDTSYFRRPHSRSSVSPVPDYERANRSLDIDYDRTGIYGRSYRNDKNIDLGDGVYYNGYAGGKSNSNYKSINPNSNITNNTNNTNSNNNSPIPSSAAQISDTFRHLESSLLPAVEQVMRDIRDQRRVISSLEARTSRTEFKLQNTELSNRSLREKISFLEGRIAQLEDSLYRVDSQQLQLRNQLRATATTTSSTIGQAQSSLSSYNSNLSPELPSSYSAADYRRQAQLPPVDSSARKYSYTDNYKTEPRPRETDRLSIMGDETANLLRPYRN